MAADPGLAHLVPGAQAAALLPGAERLALLRTERWWIAHDRAEAALARLEILLRDGPGQIRPPNLLLAGPTNNGKSWIVERFVRAHEVPSDEDAERRPVVAMQMPTEPTVGRFYAALLAHLGAPVARARRGHPRRLAAIRTDPQLENRFEPFVLPAWRPGCCKASPSCCRCAGRPVCGAPGLWAASSRAPAAPSARWLRTGRLFNARHGFQGDTFEDLPAEQRGTLLQVTGAVVRHQAVRPARCRPGTMLRAYVTQCDSGQLCIT